MKKRPILHRERVNQQLREAFDCPLAVIVAPMGFGKTTALETFFENVSGMQVWLELNEDEVLPQDIWDLLLDTIKRKNRDLYLELQNLGFPLNQFQQNRVFEAIQRHAKRKKIFLIIENYQHVQSEVFDHFIEMAVRYGMENTSLVLVSRKPLALHQDELVMKGLCGIVDSEQLLMTKAEIRELCAIRQVFPSPKVIDRIFERTEGWTAAVCTLIDHFLQYGEFEVGSSLENLIERVVLDDCEHGHIHELMQLSLLNAFTLDQAVEVIVNRSRNEIWSVCESCGLLRHKHDAKDYAFYPFFRRYLSLRLERSFSSSEKQAIHQRTGQSLIRCGGCCDGCKHLMIAEAYEEVLEVFENPCNLEMLANHPSMMDAVFTAIPRELIQKHPMAFVNYLGLRSKRYEKSTGLSLLRDLESEIEKRADLAEKEKNWILSRIELTRSCFAEHDLRKIHEHHKRARMIWRDLPRVDRGLFPHPYRHSACLLIAYHRQPGQLQSLIASVADQCHSEKSMMDRSYNAFVNQLQAEYYLETGDLKKAGQFAKKVICMTQRFKQNDLTGCAHLTLLRSYFAQGMYGKAQKAADTLKVLKSERPETIFESACESALNYAGFLLSNSSAVKMKEAVDQTQSHLDDAGFSCILAGRAFLHQKDYINLEVLTEEMLPVFLQATCIFACIHGWIFDAIAKFRLYGTEASLDSLKAAVDLAKKDGLILPFLEYSKELLPLFAAVQNQIGQQAFMYRLLEGMDQYRYHLKNHGDLLESAQRLSEREKEIMRLILEGKSNREIATDLFIAEVTVKKHVSSIYKKLEVNGRTMAVKKCLELGVVL